MSGTEGNHDGCSDGDLVNEFVGNGVAVGGIYASCDDDICDGLCGGHVFTYAILIVG